MKKPTKQQIEATADAIKDHFIPKNKDQHSFSFHFTIPPSSNYKVKYKKDAIGSWCLENYEEDAND